MKAIIEYNDKDNNSINKSDKKELTQESKAIITSPKSNQRIETNQNTKENALSLYGKDLTESAKKGLLDPVIGREDEINNLIHDEFTRADLTACALFAPLFRPNGYGLKWPTDVEEPAEMKHWKASHERALQSLAIRYEQNR